MIMQSRGVDYIFQTDSDGQTDPKEFADFWHMTTEFDAIIGWRQLRGDGKRRALVEKVVCFLLKVYFGVEVPDANAPFRLMKADVVKKYLGRLDVDYNLPNVMITAYLSYYKEKLAFKEITFKPRQGGVDSLNMIKILNIGWKSLKDFRKFKREM